MRAIFSFAVPTIDYSPLMCESLTDWRRGWGGIRDVTNRQGLHDQPCQAVRLPKEFQFATDEAAFLPYMEVVALDEDTALHYAEIRADLKRRGAMIGANDLFIAAHARALGLTLVTSNTAEFGRVEGLKLENWTQPARARRR